MAAKKWAAYFWVLICLLCFSSVASAKRPDFSDRGLYLGEAVPGWVQRQSYDSRESPRQGYSSQYLLVDSQINLVAEEAFYYRNVGRIVNPSGLTEWSEINIRYSPEYQKVHLHSLDVIREGERLSRLDKAKVRILQQEDDMESGLYYGMNTAVVILDDLRAGDIVSYEVTVLGSNPIFNGHEFGSVSLDWRVPVEKRSLRLVSDPAKPLYYRFMNSTADFNRKETVHGLEYDLVLTDIDGVLAEEDLPYGFSPYAWLAYSQFHDWGHVNQWAIDLYRIDYDGKQIKSVAEKIMGRSSDRNDFIRNALFFVQDDIRYLGLEMGVNSHLPHSPDEVLRRRFGDCKDKTALFVSLLEQQGIKAYPALVSTANRHGVSEDLPSPGSFDHVITYLEVDGKGYWLDPTNSYQGGSLDSIAQSDYGYALVVRDGTKSLTRMFPEGSPADRIRVKETFTADDFSGEVTYRIVTRYTGKNADYQRYRFSNNPLSEISRQYLSFYKGYYDSVSAINNPEFRDDRQNNVVTVEEEYRVDDFWHREDGMVIMDVNALIYADYLKDLASVDRKSPYYQGAPLLVDSIIDFHLPEDVSLNFPKPTGQVSHKAIQFNYRDSYKDKVYSYASSMELIEPVVRNADMESYKKALNDIIHNWNFTIRFADPERVPGYREALALKQRLKELAK